MTAHRKSRGIAGAAAARRLGYGHGSGVMLPIVMPGQNSLDRVCAGRRQSTQAARRGLSEFFELVSGHISSAVADARAYEEERQRAEALAEIDRAKTAFFSNVSHEFRTPLTLMLGPARGRAGEHEPSPPAARTSSRWFIATRLRLLKLVNTLLDFSRIEAGRIQAVYEPTDLAAFTARSGQRIPIRRSSGPGSTRR